MAKLKKAVKKVLSKVVFAVSFAIIAVFAIPIGILLLPIMLVWTLSNMILKRLE